MILLNLMSLLLSPLLGLALLCYLSELCRERVLGLVGVRPMIPETAEWWEVFRIRVEDGWTMAILQEMDRRLGVRLERSWYPLTDRRRRREAFDEALIAWREQEQRAHEEREAQRARWYAAGGPSGHGSSGPSGEGASGGSGRAGTGPGPDRASGRRPSTTGNVVAWWVVLGVARTSPWPEVKRAYRVLRSQHGPYLRGVASPEEAAVSHPAMLRLNEAFEAAQDETGNV